MISNLKSVITFSHRYHFSQCKRKVTTEVRHYYKKWDFLKVKTITMNRQKKKKSLQKVTACETISMKRQKKSQVILKNHFF